MYSKEDIVAYYNLSEVHYRLFWNLNKSYSLHYGYWDKFTKNFHEALLNTNKILSEAAAIKKDERVLDAGCGIGGSSLWLAKNINCFVSGISLSKKQIDKANHLAEQQCLQERVCFEQKDFTETGYPDASFDVVWAIESVCHAEHKQDFIREAFRLLKPGGRLIMADFFKNPNLEGKDREQVQRWANGWAINDFATIEEFSNSLKESGFSQVEISNATTNILPSAKRLYNAYFIGIIGAKIYGLTNARPTALGRNNVDTAYLQYRTLKKGLWKYLIVKAIKL